MSSKNTVTKTYTSLDYVMPPGLVYRIEIYSGITRGRALSGEHYGQRLQKLNYLYLFPDCFMKMSRQ